MANEICGLCLQPWEEGHDCGQIVQNPDLLYGNRLAIMLSCALIDPVGCRDDAERLLDEYRHANRRWNEHLERVL